MYSGTAGKGWKLAAIPQNQPQKLARRPVPWRITARFRQRAKEPAEIELIRPLGDMNLIAAQEGYGRSNAVDRRRVAEIAPQVEAKPLLVAAAKRHNHMLRPLLLDQGKQLRIFNRARAL
jgi:hypothetical protein